MPEANERPNFAEFIKPDLKRDECVKIIQSLLTPEEITALGGENAADKVIDGLSYLGVFAPAPATFDRGAFLFTTSGIFDGNEGVKAWNICKQLGIFKDESEVDPGRVSISEDLKEMLENPENGYLT
ncbi:MAG TPA: hypothetical protein VKC54_03310 [Patescibacteria group bacterium]|nr:hypothetical protein [Patescibacteria group bacterium]